MATSNATFRIASFRQIVADAPVSYSVYSAFSFYGARRGAELPGTWLVNALGTLGHEVSAVRQTLYRMERTRELQSRIEGRSKFYRLTAAASAEAGAGLAKIMEDSDNEWNGEWTFVQLRNDTEERVERERLREVMRAEGFAAVGSGLFVHPRDRSARVMAAAKGHDMSDMIEVFCGRRVSAGSDRDFVARHWALDELADSYTKFIKRFQPLADMRGKFGMSDAFVLRFAVVFDFLEIGWKDPDLPSKLLPQKWPGLIARRLARSLYQRLLPSALLYGDSLMQDIG